MEQTISTPTLSSFSPLSQILGIGHGPEKYSPETKKWTTAAMTYKHRTLMTPNCKIAGFRVEPEQASVSRNTAGPKKLPSFKRLPKHEEQRTV